MAEWLNDWTAAFTDRVPEATRCATFFPEPEAHSYVAARGAPRLGLPDHPYAYEHQIESLERLGFGDDWLRAVLWDNGVRLIGPGQPAVASSPHDDH